MRIWGKKILGRVNSECKGLEVGMSLPFQDTAHSIWDFGGEMKLVWGARARSIGPQRLWEEVYVLFWVQWEATGQWHAFISVFGVSCSLGRGAWIARSKSVEACFFTVEISTVLQDILYPWTVPWTCQLCGGGTFWRFRAICSSLPKTGTELSCSVSPSVCGYCSLTLFLTKYSLMPFQ